MLENGLIIQVSMVLGTHLLMGLVGSISMILLKCLHTLRISSTTLIRYPKKMYARSIALWIFLLSLRKKLVYLGISRAIYTARARIA
jgi:hypothetical protein